MTTIVSDTSPINYLCLIGEIDVLPKVFSEVLIPPAVLAELRHSRAPKAVAEWLANMPAWARTQAPISLKIGLGLDPGETEAISLALELGLPILIDERNGRLVAEEHGITAVGTLNILYSADVHGFLDFEAAVERLRRTNFHVDHRTIEALILQSRSRKKRGG